MPRKGMRALFFSPSASSSPSHSSRPTRSPPPSTPHNNLTQSIINENLEIAESVIRKWDVEQGSIIHCRIDSLFTGDEREAKVFLSSVKDLHAAMQFLVSEDPSSEKLIRAQSLMQIAMKRLEKEFHRILSMNRSHLDPESVSNRSLRESASARSSTSDFEDYASEDEVQATGDSVSEVERASDLATADLKTIADTMISSGHGKECLKIYKLIRKSIVDESLYYLGVEKLSLTQIQKMDWEIIELKTTSWLKAVKIAVTSLFRGERSLCEHVFSASPMIAEWCFADIVGEGAMTLFGFPNRVAKYKKLSPEKLFRILDLYDAISELWPEIEFIFSYESMSAVRSQAVSSLIKLGEVIRAMLADFEMAIQKDNSKTAVPGGGVHPLTRYVMNYIIFLSDYSGILSDILADWPPLIRSPMPESYFSSSVAEDHPASAISVRFAWLILVLLCKLDVKAELYKDVALSYLFLANNLNYIVLKVRSSNLKILLGNEWLVTHEKKVKQYAANCQRIGWSKVFSSLPEINPTAELSLEAVRECFRNFSSAFEEAYRKQSSWVVPERKLRDDIKMSLAKNLVPPYSLSYNKYRPMFKREIGVESFIRYVPEDLRNYISDSFSSSASSSSHSLEGRSR